MSLPLPPDPYKALGIAKDAAISEIKSSYRKLVLKCHPDKVQDPTLKAQKQDEFQKVQEAYELLTDDTKRTDYDEKIKMFAFRDSLRSQAPKSSPQAAPRSPPASHKTTTFDYEVRTAEPRSARFKSARAPSPVRVYTTARPASFEDEPSRMYDMGSRSARKAASYEERKKTSTKDEERRRRADEEREHERWEKEVNRKHLSASKKSRDKERKKGSEEKSSRRTAFIVNEEDSSDGYRPRFERRSSKKSDEKIHVTSDKGVNEFVITERTRKLHHANETAAQYIQAAKMKASKAAPDVEFRPRPIQRSETYHVPPYSTRYPVPPPQPYIDDSSDDDHPRRSSARPRSRRPSDQLPPRPHNPSRTPGSEPFIVTADPSSRKPTLQTHISAPPLVSESRRKEPQRSQTIQTEYTRRSSPNTPPSLSRASTYSEKSSRPSRLHTAYAYDDSTSDSSDSDSDIPIHYTSPSRSSRPAASGRTTQKHYVVEKPSRSSGAVPVSRSSHRKIIRDDSFAPRDRSESPRGTSSRPSLRTSPRTQTYYAEDIHIPSATPSSRSKRDVPRSAGGLGSSGVNVKSSSKPGGGAFFGEVKYAPAFRPEDVSYGEYYRGGPTSAADYYQQGRRGEATAYA